jgi:hypothetical protein
VYLSTVLVVVVVVSHHLVGNRNNIIYMHAPENDAAGIYQAVAQNIPTQQHS